MKISANSTAGPNPRCVRATRELYQLNGLWFAGPQPPGDLPDLPRADQERFVRDAGWTVVQRLKSHSW